MERRRMNKAIRVVRGIPFIGSFVLVITVGMTLSCSYREYAEADYLGQIIYMPVAGYNIYEVDESIRKPGIHPTEGNRYRYRIDMDQGIFVVPLGVYRSGMDNKGSVEVSININTDTITDLVTDGLLDSVVQLLPGEQYNLPAKVTLNDGYEFEPFNLDVDLRFLQKRYSEEPDKKYAIAVEIRSHSRPVNKELGTAIILIDPKAAIK